MYPRICLEYLYKSAQSFFNFKKAFTPNVQYVYKFYLLPCKLPPSLLLYVHQHVDYLNSLTQSFIHSLIHLVHSFGSITNYIKSITATRAEFQCY